MKKFIIGFIMGVIVAGGIAWAAVSYSWVDKDGVAVGTTTNPVTIKIQ